MRREPDLELPLLGGGRLRRGAVRSNVPGLIPFHLGVLLLAAEDELGEAHFFLRRFLIVVDGPSITGQVAAGPFLTRRERLPKEGVHPRPGVLDRFGVAHGSLGVVENAVGVFGTGAGH